MTTAEAMLKLFSKPDSFATVRALDWDTEAQEQKIFFFIIAF